jgi:hypothetical protein
VCSHRSHSSYPTWYAGGLPSRASQASAAALHCAAGVCNMFIACGMSLDVRVAAGGPRANEDAYMSTAEVALPLALLNLSCADIAMHAA